MADEELDELDGLLPLPIDRSGAGIGVRDNRDAALGADSDQPRLSLGQRIAGVKDLAAAPPPDAAPVVRPQFDPNAIPEAIRPRQITPNQVPVPPSGAQNPRLAELAKQQAAVSTPINPLDTATGKIKPQYRMGMGQRILGGVSAALSGFAGRQYNGPGIGPGATNWKFGREEAARQGQLEGINTQIKTQEQLDSENEKLYRDATRQAYEGQLGEARLGASKAQQETAGVKQQLEQSQEELNRARANKADQDKTPTSEFSGWYEAFTRDNGRRPTAKEISAEAARQKSAGKDTSAADLNKALTVENQRQRELDSLNRERDAERAKRHDEFSKSKEGRFDFDGKKRAAFDAQLQQELDPKYSDRLQSVNERYDRMLGLTKSGKALQSNAPASSKSTPNTPAKTSAPPKPTDPAPAGRVWVYDLKTGKRGTIPKEQLPQAKQAGYGTW